MFLKDLQGFLWFLNAAITFYSVQFALRSQGGKATGLGCLCVHVFGKGKCRMGQPRDGPTQSSQDTLGVKRF